ncbi:unnamed protein product [Urochloa decumbens]|uniref:F-box domain-containing protein n=1 Tax=Urochloa decumbens TaxID=240449 RepID=A0ABC9BGF9_9POAL
MADEDLSLPDDVFVPILLHLPTSSRRRFCLVCKRWRDVIDERTPDRDAGRHQDPRLRQPAQQGLPRHRLRQRRRLPPARVDLPVLTRAQHHRLAPGKRSFSIVTVTNPITGETMALPPPPESSEPEQERAQAGKYSFGYHPTTGVHPRRRRAGDTASWRDVPLAAPGGGAICSPLSDAVSVDGRTYWLDASAASRVMALDLADERVTSFAAPPPPACPGLLPAAGAGWELTSVHGRLGAVATTAIGRGGCATPRTSDYWIVAPELTHGEYILRSSRDRMTRDDYRIWGYAYGRRRLYRHKVCDLAGGGGGGGGEDDGQSPAEEGRELLMSAEESHGDLTTFAYVETLEPLPR